MQEKSSGKPVVFWDPSVAVVGYTVFAEDAAVVDSAAVLDDWGRKEMMRTGRNLLSLVYSLKLN